MTAFCTGASVPSACFKVTLPVACTTCAEAATDIAARSSAAAAARERNLANIVGGLLNWNYSGRCQKESETAAYDADALMPVVSLMPHDNRKAGRNATHFKRKRWGLRPPPRRRRAAAGRTSR